MNIIGNQDITIETTTSQQTTMISTSMKKIKKSAQHEIDILLQKFLDSYIASTTFDTEDNLTQDLL